MVVVLMLRIMMMMIATVTVFAQAGNDKSMKLIDSPVRQSHLRFTSVYALVISWMAMPPMVWGHGPLPPSLRPRLRYCIQLIRIRIKLQSNN